jgi:2-polyprenyl-3-methyl-5-hydroxy-6-metoxy-1,4-benzoquinol methylase
MCRDNGLRMDLKEADNFGEARHPWERARADHFIRIAKVTGLFDRPLAWLDFGAGDAYSAAQVAEHAPRGASITCWDSNYDPERIAMLRKRYPKLRYVRDEPEGKFDVLLLLDVLEHIEDDRVMLGQLVRERLRDGGRVLMSVPAWMVLFGRRDRFLGHFRRYTPRTATALLEGAGLTIELRGGLFHTLLLARAAQRAAELIGPARAASAADGARWAAGHSMTRVVSAVLSVDVGLSRRAARHGVQLPGLSWWALCRK